MNRYKEKYTIYAEFLAESDEEADKVTEKNLNAVFGNGEFFVRRFKIDRKIVDDVEVDEEI